MENREQQKRVDEIFNQACELDGFQLEDYLEKACGNDAAIRKLVERLLSADLELRAAPKYETKAVVSDRNLLVGIVALQMNFVSRDTLIQAMQVCILNKKEPIENIFHAMGALDEKTRMLLTALVDKHLAHHDNDPEKSLASLSSIGDLRNRLAEIRDPEIGKSLQNLDTNSSSRLSDANSVTLGFPSKKDGRFRVLRHHKDGGLGMISVARDEELNRNVALKEVRVKYAANEAARERLRVEAEITGGLEHPGIVPVYGLGTYNDGRPFYCMRFIKGDSLRDAIKMFHQSKTSLSRSQQVLELRSLLRRFIDVCDAIGYAHSRSILHRDLKPDNIMLGRYGETLVVDWGLAKATADGEADKEYSVSADQPIVPRSGSSAAQTMAGSAIGTPRYMSPEQAAGRIDLLGPATDVYSLGATLYCVLTGQSAFTSENRDEILFDVRNGMFLAPTKIDISVPSALEAICLKAMQKQPDNRYQSPTDIGMDLERWLAGEPVSVFSEPWTERLARYVRLHRTVFAGIAAALVMALIASGVVITLSKIKNDQLNKLNSELAQAQDHLQDDFSNARKLAFDMIEQAESGELSLAQIPGERARKHRFWITNRAISVFEPLLSRRPDDPDVKREMARLYRYAANLDRLNGEYGDAAEKYSVAIQHLEQIIATNPDDPRARDRLVLTLADFAPMLRRANKLVEGRQQLEKSEQIVGQLRIENPDSMAYRRSEGLIQMEFTAVLTELADPKEALKRAEKCTELFKELVDSRDQTRLDPILLSFSMTKQSELLRYLNRLPDADALSQEAIKRTKAAATDDSSRGMQHALAKIHLERSHVISAQDKDTSLPKKHIHDAIKIWSGLKEKHLTSTTYPRYLALAHTALGQAKSKEQQPEDARREFDRSVKILRELVEREQTTDVLEAISDVLTELAALERSLGNTDQAKEFVKQSVEYFMTATDLVPENKRMENKLNLQLSR